MFQAGLVVSVCLFAALPRAGPLVAVEGQRYAMGTMFDVVVYHHARTEAEHAIDRALAEIVRLDRVLSHFDPGSDLSALVRHADAGARRVDASLYEIIETSLEISRRTRGTFDITVGPLVRMYLEAREHGRRPSAEEIGAARACIGYERIELVPPDRVRLNGECLDIDLGGIGKGYAVDRAVALLREAGVRHALVNAGGSSIGAIGAPPGRAGWPVVLGTDTTADAVVLLRDQSLGTSRAIAGSPGSGDIVDPRAGVPARGSYGVSVLAPAAAVSDGLATALVMLPIEQGTELVAQFDDVEAVWLSPQGVVQAVHGRPALSGPVAQER